MPDKIKIEIGKGSDKEIDGSKVALALAEDILQELKSERETKNYIVNEILPDLKKEIRELRLRLSEIPEDISIAEYEIKNLKARLSKYEKVD